MLVPQHVLVDSHKTSAGVASHLHRKVGQRPTSDFGVLSGLMSRQGASGAAYFSPSPGCKGSVSRNITSRKDSPSSSPDQKVGTPAPRAGPEGCPLVAPRPGQVYSEENADQMTSSVDWCRLVEFRRVVDLVGGGKNGRFRTHDSSKMLSVSSIGYHLTKTARL